MEYGAADCLFALHFRTRCTLTIGRGDAASYQHSTVISEPLPVQATERAKGIQLYSSLDARCPHSAPFSQWLAVPLALAAPIAFASDTDV